MIRHPKKRAMLAALSASGNVRLAAESAGIHRSMHYTWLRHDERYAEAVTAAMEEAADRLEEEARRRAVEGVEEPVYQGGKRVGTIRRYSDTLLIFLLKGARPAKYRSRSSIELAGPNGGAIPLALIDQILRDADADAAASATALDTDDG